MGERENSLSHGLPSAFLHVPPKDIKRERKLDSLNYKHRTSSFSTGGSLWRMWSQEQCREDRIAYRVVGWGPLGLT